jgi:sensor c-di-GMP phosphodiesterase-like protein
MRDLEPLMGQGYLFSKPLPPEGFREYLHAQTGNSEVANT